MGNGGHIGFRVSMQGQRVCPMVNLLHRFVHDLGVSTILLTVLGFVVGLALSFRSSTAYERYVQFTY